MFLTRSGKCLCGYLLLYQLVEGTGNTGEVIKPVEAPKSMCWFNYGIDSPSPCTNHRNNPWELTAWGCRGGHRITRSSQSSSESHPRRLRESRSSPTITFSGLSSDEHIFRDPSPWGKKSKSFSRMYLHWKSVSIHFQVTWRS